MKRHYTVLAYFLGIMFATAQHPAAKKIDSLLSYYERTNQWMGSLTLTEDGKVIFDKAYGFSDAANNKKATPLTKYKIGSITKMFTAAVIFQLIEEKKLTLDTPLSTFYPQVPNAAKINISQMLSHRSGIFNYTNDPEFQNFVRTPQTKAQLLGKITSYPEHFAPDSKAEYSNSNYILLGYIIEDVTKKTYWENVSSRIIKKLNLKNTIYGTAINPANNEAYSYVRAANDWSAEQPWDMSLAGPAGAIVATTSDLAVFINSLFNGKIVSTTSLEKMMDLKDNYGHGMFQVPFYDKKAYGHNGGIEEFVSQAYYFPNDKIAIAMSANARGDNNNDIAIGILSFIFNKDFKFPNLEVISVDEQILSTYAGTYSSAGFPLKITISNKGNVLYAQATGQSEFPLDAKSTTEFIFKPAGVKLDFTSKGLTLTQGGGVFQFVKE